jgi:alpha-glucosidase
MLPVFGQKEGNELLFIHGPQMEDVVTNYTDLTGKPELPPLWAGLPPM